MAIEIGRIIDQQKQKAAAARDEKRLEGLKVLEGLVDFDEKIGVLDHDLAGSIPLKEVPDQHPGQPKVIVVFPIIGREKTPLQQVARELRMIKGSVAEHVNPYLAAITKEAHQVHPSSIAFFIGDLLGLPKEEIKGMSVLIGKVARRARKNIANSDQSSIK